MRVLLVCHRFPPDGITGVERYTQTLAGQLVIDGHAVSIVTRGLERSPSLPRTIRERLPDGAALYRFQGGYGAPRPALDKRLEQLFTAVLAETNPTVVHINHLLGLTPRFLSIAHRFGAAVVQSLHDFYFACPRVHLQKPSGELCDGPKAGQECARNCFAHEGAGADLRWGIRSVYFRRLLDSADRLICPSRYVASYFERQSTDPARIRVIPNAALVERGRTCEAPPKEPGSLSLACLGAVIPHKGFHVVIEALRLARLPSVNLRIFGILGDRGYARRLREQAVAVSGLQLQMYGSYRSDELSFLLQDVDCVVTPSQVAETFSITSREALVLGIPVVAARLGALPEAVVEGVNGFTFEHTSAGELALILRRLAADESLLSRLRAGARNTAVLTLSEHAAAVTAVYEEALLHFDQNGSPCPVQTEELDLLYAHLP